MKRARGTCWTTTFGFVGVLHTCCTAVADGVVFSGLCFIGLGLEIFCCCNDWTIAGEACFTGARGGGFVELLSVDEASGGLLGCTAR